MPDAKGTTKSTAKKPAVAPVQKAAAAEKMKKPTAQERMPALAKTARARKAEVKAAPEEMTKPIAAREERKLAEKVSGAEPRRAAQKSGNGEKKVKITAEQRYRMIAEAAYYRAEKRGFTGGDPAQDWAEAEAYIEKMLRE